MSRVEGLRCLGQGRAGLQEKGLAFRTKHSEASSLSLRASSDAVGNQISSFYAVVYCGHSLNLKP